MGKILYCDSCEESITRLEFKISFEPQIGSTNGDPAYNIEFYDVCKKCFVEGKNNLFNKAKSAQDYWNKGVRIKQS